MSPNKNRNAPTLVKTAIQRTIETGSSTMAANRYETTANHLSASIDPQLRTRNACKHTTQSHTNTKDRYTERERRTPRRADNELVAVAALFANLELEHVAVLKTETE